MSATRTMVREDTAIILNDDSVVSSFGFEKNLSTITAWVLILLLSYDKSTIYIPKNIKQIATHVFCADQPLATYDPK